MTEEEIKYNRRGEKKTINNDTNVLKAVNKAANYFRKSHMLNSCFCSLFKTAASLSAYHFWNLYAVLHTSCQIKRHTTHISSLFNASCCL